MSNLQPSLQSLDFSSFENGTYFKIFDTFSDIDVYEHGILTYLGSLLSVPEEEVSPSMKEIARATKMSVSTVRRKLRSLEAKGYLRISSVLYLNAAGRSQQGANHYFFLIGPTPAPTPLPAETEIDKVITAWEELTTNPVSSSERETFMKKFDDLKQPAEGYLDRIAQISVDPKLKRLAQNINFLFLQNVLQSPTVKAASSPKDAVLPADSIELLTSIRQQLANETSEANKRRLEILLEAVSKCNFNLGLRLYKKHIQHASVENSPQSTA